MRRAFSLLAALGGLLVLTAVPAVVSPFGYIGRGDRLWLWYLLAG